MLKIFNRKPDLVVHYDTTSSQRETLCNRLEEVESQLDQTGDVDIIKEILNWLWMQLDLSKVGEFWDIELPSKAYKRQINTLITSLKKCNTGDILGAYHELCDFLSNYRQNWTEPINGWEKIGIKIMIEQILTSFRVKI